MPFTAHRASRPLIASVLNVNGQSRIARYLGKVFGVKDTDQTSRERGLRETKIMPDAEVNY